MLEGEAICSFMFDGPLGLSTAEIRVRGDLSAWPAMIPTAFLNICKTRGLDPQKVTVRGVSMFCVPTLVEKKTEIIRPRFTP